MVKLKGSGPKNSVEAGKFTSHDVSVIKNGIFKERWHKNYLLKDEHEEEDKLSKKDYATSDEECNNDDN